MRDSTLILGLDPGLRHTGWGVVRSSGNRLSFIAAGIISPAPKQPLPNRLAELALALEDVIKNYAPHEAAVEETFVNANAASALKLGEARGIALMVPARAGLKVAEYAANLIKKSVTGYGHADKAQVTALVKMLLPDARDAAKDAADALAIAICHAHHRNSILTSPLEGTIKKVVHG